LLLIRDRVLRKAFCAYRLMCYAPADYLFDVGVCVVDICVDEIVGLGG